MSVVLSYRRHVPPVLPGATPKGHAGSVKDNHTARKREGFVTCGKTDSELLAILLPCPLKNRHSPLDQFVDTLIVLFGNDKDTAGNVV